jgi:hypothetical protein
MLTTTKLRGWERGLEAAQRKILAISDEIDACGDAELAQRIALAHIDLGECLTMVAATIEICRDPRGKRIDGHDHKT